MKNNKNQKIRELIGGIVAGITAAFVSTTAVFAEAVDTTKLQSGLFGMGETAQTFVNLGLFLAIIVSGFFLMLGGQQGRVIAKVTFISGAAGFAVVNFAMPLVNLFDQIIGN